MQEINSDNVDQTKKCINCGYKSEQKFCASCGQPMHVKKLNFSTLVKDLLSQIYGFDGRFLRTIAGMTVTPGDVIKSFISGNRKKYIGPASYYFLLYAILLIYTAMVDVDLSVLAPQSDDVQRGMGFDPSLQTAKQMEIQKDFREAIFKHIQYYSVLGFPFFAMAGKLFYKKSGFTFIEHFVTAFYIHAQPLFLSFITITIFKISGFSIQSYFFLVTFIFYFWSISKVYSHKANFLSILKAVAFYLVYYICFVLSVAIAIAIISIFYY